MPGILISGLFLLRFPVARDIAKVGAFNTYLASWKIGGHEFAFSIAQPLKHTKQPLLPHGINAEVEASLVVHNKSLRLTATAVCGLHVATDDGNRAATQKLYQPVLEFSGKITNVHPFNSRTPGVRCVDVTVDCGDGHPTTLTCFMNRTGRRLLMLAPSMVGMSVTISGELTGWVDGLLAVDVLHFDFNNGGPLPEGRLASLPDIFPEVDFETDFASFADRCSLPPLAGLPSSLANASSPSSRWLETVAPLPSAAGPSARAVRRSPGARRRRTGARPSSSPAPSEPRRDAAREHRPPLMVRDMNVQAVAA